MRVSCEGEGAGVHHIVEAECTLPDAYRGVPAYSKQHLDFVGLRGIHKLCVSSLYAHVGLCSIRTQGARPSTGDVNRQHVRRDVDNGVGVFRLGSQPGDQEERGRLLRLALDLCGSHVLCRNSGTKSGGNGLSM